MNNSADPAQLAIQRAQQKRASKADLSPDEKSQQAVTSLKARIDKAQLKLETAKAENSDKLEIFENTLISLQQKLAVAEQALAATQVDTGQAQDEHKQNN